MAVIPKYDTPQSGAPATAGFTPVSGGNASPDAFGAGVGQAQSQFGATVEKVGDQFAQEAQNWQKQENEAAANQATTDYLVAQSKLTEEFKLLQGKDPQNALPKYLADLQELRSKMRGGLTNPEVQRMFDHDSTRQFGYAVMNAGSHAATQLKQYQNNAYNAKIAATVHATTGAEEQSVFEKGLEDIANNVRQGEFKGQAPEVIEGRIRDEQGKAWAKRLSDVAKNEPQMAREILTKNRGKIDGIVAQNAEDFINKMDVAKTSQRIANSTALGGATETQQQRQDYAMSYLTTRYGKIGAAALVGQAMAESKLNPKAINPGDGADGTDSVHIIQWNSDRVSGPNGLKAFADKNGLDINDFKTGVQFIDHELQTRYPKVAAALKSAASVEDAAKIATLDYVVPAGAQTRDTNQVKSFPERLANAQSLMGKTVMPIATIQPGNRGALENAAVAQANKYADEQKLDQATREDLIAHTRNHVDTLYGKQMATVRDAAVGGKATLRQFVDNGPDGKNPVTSIDQVMGPNAPEEVRNAYLQLPPADQDNIRKIVQRNASGELTPTVATEETRARRQQLQGQMQLDPEAFLKVDPTKEKLTRQDIQWLTSQQQRLVTDRNKQDATAGNTDRAMRILRNAKLLDIDGLRDKDVKLDPERYQKFQGGMSMLLDQYNVQHNGKVPSEDDIKKMAKDLLTEQVTSKGWLWGVNTAPRYQTDFKVNNPPKFEAIPQDAINKIQAAYKEAGNPNPTPQMIRKAYAKKLGASANAQ